MKKILLITSQFPYEGGEQFLETEIKYYDDKIVTILPRSINGVMRDIPMRIEVNNFLANKIRKGNKFLYLLKSLKRKLFYKEVFSSFSFNLKKLQISLISLYAYEMYYDIFDDYFSKQSELDELVVYTYWHDSTTYALQSLKRKYGYKLISRIHGSDLYQERKIFNHMPLKKYFANNIDKIYTITASANSYLKNTYGFKKDILGLSRLGVDDKNIIAKATPPLKFSILSCSFLSKVKRVDKIIVSLKILADKNKDIRFTWSHIGDGEETEELIELAKKHLDLLDNLEYHFLGNYKNEEVYQFYENNRVDVFVNVSESEGVPVSIMEAMSCHVPIIAPNIGGVSDMVNKKYDNGVLLSHNGDIEEIVSALNNIEYFKKMDVRENAYRVFLDKYNAQKNYSLFVKNL